MRKRLFYIGSMLAASIILAMLLTYAGGFWLHTLHSATHRSSIEQWLRESTLLLPFVLLAVVFARVLAGRLQRSMAMPQHGLALYAVLAALIASVMASAGAPLAAFALSSWANSGGNQVALFVCSLAGISADGAQIEPMALLRDGMLQLPVMLLMAGLWAVVPSLYRRSAAVLARWAMVARMVARRGALGGSAIVAVLLSPMVTQLAAPVSAAPAQCDSWNANRSYDVAAINLSIPYNRWGDIDFDGMMYVLEQDRAAVENWYLPLNADPSQDPAGNRRLRPRPLVLRANAGDCIQINFTNRLQERQWGGKLIDPRASIHVIGLSYNAQTSDGGRVGYNEDTTVGRGETMTYYWKAPAKEAMFNFRDMANPTGSEADGGSVAHGLFGALVVEPAGSIWRDGITGKRLYTDTRDLSGDLYIDAIIEPPGQPAFRETVQLAQDEIPGIGFGFNYGAEPEHNRDANRCPDCIGEETSLSSWTYGDPAMVKLASGMGPWVPDWQLAADDPQKGQIENCGLGTPGFNVDSCWTANVTHAYRWDRFKLRYALSMVYETHIFHLHANQWRVQDADPNSNIIDSQTFGPGDAFTADLIGGAGSLPGTVGDSIFHCHLYPHFADGFWALLRVHDVLEDGTNINPDGVIVAAVEPLPSGNLQNYTPPVATEENPGYPRFIPGTYGWRAPQPVLGISEQRPENVDTVPGNEIPDDPTTIVREDLVTGMRMVAGQALDPALLTADLSILTPAQQELREKLLTEQQAMQTISGGRSKPGAPFADPCPTGARELTYNVSIIQMPIVYNEAGWFDSQARILVLDKDVADVAAGRKAAEPFFMRANQGDCINLNLTNRLPNWFGNDAFVQMIQTNMMGGHIHLVKFDVLASDGSSNGWNYQQATFTQAQTNFKNAILAGTARCTADEALGACRLPNPADYDPMTKGLWPGQTLHERWYADTELRTIFTHDHHFAAADQNRGQFGALIIEPAGMDMRHPSTGQFFQPINNAANGTPCGSACNAEAVGTRMDVIGPGPADDYREFGLAIQDFVSLTRKGGNPRLHSDTINAPPAPEPFPKGDPGTMAINYRNAPFQERRFKNGQYVDPAYIFSSTVWGDPMTPLLEAYAGDQVQFRIIQGSQEEQHVFQIHGLRWRQESDDPTSPLVNSMPIGISEAFNFKLPSVECGWDEDCRGDYLYSSAATDDVYNGVWGIFRVYGRNRTGLLPLPDTQPQNMNGNVTFRPTGAPPAMATNPGTPCIPGSPTRQFTVVAHDAQIVYNEYGYQDPYGLVYTAVRPGETIDQAMARAKLKPEVMVLRANEGDCIEVTLHNRISQSWLDNHGLLGVRDGDAPMPTEPFEGTPAGLRVSLHTQLLRYDVRGSDGATVGYNKDQTVAPGQSYTYRWFADEVYPGELGAINLLEYGDLRGHRHHGLSAGIVIGPRNATYHDPFTGNQVIDGAFVDVRVPLQADYRDLTVFYQDGLNLRRADGSFVPEPESMIPLEPGEVPEPPEGGPPNPFHPLNEGSDENAGEKAFNYGSEPLNERLGRLAALATVESPLIGREMADLFSSVVHGDPATPILRAYAGDPVRVRVLQTGDRPRQHVFAIGGHAWLTDPYDPNSRLVGAEGGMSVARAMNLHLPSAGGEVASAGDFKYGSLERTFFESRGLWGIFRVYTPPSVNGLFKPQPLLTVDNSYTAGYAPLMPLEVNEIAATVFADNNLNAARNTGETSLAGIPVLLKSTSGVVLDSALTDANGRVVFQAAPNLYDLEVVPGADWSGTTATLLRADARAENARVAYGFGIVQLGDITLTAFNDRDGDGVQASDGSEPALSGWQVRLTQGTTTLQSAATDGSGLAIFSNLRPGTYKASVTSLAGWNATTNQPLNLEIGPNGSLQAVAGFALRGGMSVKLFNDSNSNGIQDAGESNLSGWQVYAFGGSANLPTSTYSERTDTQGVVNVGVYGPTVNPLMPGLYDITVTAPRGWSCATVTKQVSAAEGTNSTNDGCSEHISTELLGSTTQVVSVGFRNPNRWVSVEPFADVNRNGIRESGEGKLIGWSVELYDSANNLIGTGTTGTDGKVSWSLTMSTFEPRTYKARVIAPTGASIPWDRTGSEFVTLNVPAGERRTAQAGFVQVSSVSVAVFNDHDQDRTWDAVEEPLANRNVILYNSTGKTVLGTAVTDANGRAALRITAGQTYYVEVGTVAASWVRTFPVDTKSVAIQKLKIVAPTNNTSLEAIFGQYNTSDLTPPPAPAVVAPGGSYDGPINVGFESETGATFRYTLDGSNPSATNGHPLIGTQITLAVSGTTTLKVAALDKKGNISTVVTQNYTIAYPAEVTPAITTFSTGPTAWKAIYGGIQSGFTPNVFYTGDGLTLVHRNTKIGPDYIVDGYWSTILPAGQRNLSALSFSYNHRVSKVGPSHLVYAYNFVTGQWESLSTATTAPTAATARQVTVTGDPNRFVSATGEVRLRLHYWTNAVSFTTTMDQVNFTTSFQP